MRTCGYCGHVHRETTLLTIPGTLVFIPKTIDVQCECGCTEEGWRYDNGPSILDSPMPAQAPS